MMKDFIKGIYMGFRFVLKNIAEKQLSVQPLWLGENG